jgi:hypothetical protein
MGRPTLEMFCVFGLTPSAWQTVAMKSGTGTGRSSTAVPSLLVRPTTCPPLMPPPASTVVQATG